MTINLKRMIEGYTECIDWTDCGPDSDCVGAAWSDALHKRNEVDCARFVEMCGTALLDELAENAPGYSDERFGHDFWLTRNGHGAGFWDREELEPHGLWGKSLGDALTIVAERIGPCELYTGDDGLVYAI